MSAALYAQITTDTRGHRRRHSSLNGAASNAAATAASAGLGRRPASTRPNAQSSIRLDVAAYIRKPSLFDNLLPNTWHLGAGIEYVPLRSVNGVDFGVKADAAVHTHNLGVRPRSGDIAFVQDSRIYRWVFSLTGNLSF